MITQEDIAKKLNISRTTVSRALKGKNVSEETRRYVCENAERMGYIQNSAATSLAIKRCMTVYAFIVATVDEGYGEQMYRGIAQVAEIWRGYNYKVEVIYTDIRNNKSAHIEQLSEFYRVMNECVVDGIIFSALTEENMAAVSLECKARNIPLMTLDMIYRDVGLCHLGPDYYNLGTYSAAYMANIMMKRGRILTISYDEGYEIGMMRMEGFHRKLEEYEGIECLDLAVVDMSEEAYFSVLETSLRQFRPVAVYAPYHVEYIGKFINLAGLRDDILLISNGVNKLVEEYLFDGTINAIVSARPQFLGAVAANNFFKYFYRRNEMLTGEIDVACDIYIKENYLRYDRIF